MAVNEGMSASLGGVILARIFHVARSSTNRIGSLEHDPSPRLGRAIAKCWRWMRSFGVLQRIGIRSTGSYGAGLLRFNATSKVTVLEVTTPDKQDRRRRGKNDVSTRRTPPMPPLQASGP